MVTKRASSTHSIGLPLLGFSLSNIFGQNKKFIYELLHFTFEEKIMKKQPLKKLPKCYGDPEAECVSTCALEPACANDWLFKKEGAKE
jgi:hypothetical protein